MTKLTPRQLETLEQIARGQSMNEAAHNLGVSRSWVEKSLAEARKRLNARTIPNAVYLAAKSGLIAVVLWAGLSDHDMLRPRPPRTRPVVVRMVRRGKD